MNQLFSFHRFLLLLRLDLAERGRGYMFSTGLLTGFLLLLMLPITLADEHNFFLLELHSLALFLVVILGGSLYSSSVFNQYASTDTGIAALMLPASRLEKFLNALLVQLVVIVPVTLFFFVFHPWSVEYANNRLPAGGNKYWSLPADRLHYLLGIHVILQGAVFLGSVWFRKLAYLKTIVTFFVLAITAACVSYLLARQSAPPGSEATPRAITAFPLSAWKIRYLRGGQTYYVDHPESLQALIYAFPLLVLLVLWLTAFARLKEKEI